MHGLPHHPPIYVILGLLDPPNVSAYALALVSPPSLGGAVLMLALVLPWLGLP